MSRDDKKPNVVGDASPRAPLRLYQKMDGGWTTKTPEEQDAEWSARFGGKEPEEWLGFWRRLSLRFWLTRKRIVWFIEKITRRSRRK